MRKNDGRRHRAIGKTLSIAMNLTAFILITATLQVNATVYSQITLSETNAPLQKVLRQIHKQSGYDFFYTYELLEQAGRVTVKLKDVPLETAVSEVLKGKDLSYEIMGNTIVIKKKPTIIVKQEERKNLIDYKGRILNENGEPLVGASVKIKGTSSGTSTDAEGKFTINANPGQILVVSFVGYENRELSVGAEPNLSVQLELSTATLAEVVVGYGTRKQQNVTGAVSMVTAEAIKSRPVTNALGALQGTLPGVIIQRGSGKPGSEEFKLNVRGNSTVDRNPDDNTDAGNTPLVLIDGLAGGIDLLNPDDIESVTVLKDAAASIYGARAANGVVLVTTKKGKKGVPKVSFSSNAAISKIAGMMNSPTNYEFAQMDNEANAHAGASPMYTPELLEKIRNNDPNPIPHPLYGGWNLFFTNTDWRKELYGNGFQHKQYLNVSGGGENSRYYLSGGIADQYGVIKYANDNNKRYNLRMNYDYNFTKRIRLESKVSLESQKRTDIGGNGTWSGTITEGVFGMPNHPVYTPDGKFFAQGGWGNAVAQAKEGATATFLSRTINTNFKLIAEVADGLKLNVQAGVNFRTDKDEDIAKPIPLYNWDGTIAYYDIASPGFGSLTLRNGENTYRNFTGYAEYNKSFGNHEFGIMAGTSHEENDMEWFNARRDNFISEELWSINLGGRNNMSNDGGGNHWAITSVFSRINYTFNNEYLIEANLRYDGSSRFPPKKKWAFFPGVSAAWRLSEKDFIRNTGIFDDLKLRVSYGETGNQEGIGLYDYLQLLTTARRTYPYPFGAGVQSNAVSLSGMAALESTWETLVNQNAGLDATMLNGRLNFSFDYFIKKNKNLLIPVTYPALLGTVAPFSNAGTLKTKGFELTLGWKDRVGSLDYSARILLSDAQNELINYGGGDTYAPGLNPNREGYPLSTYFAYQFDGIIRDQRELDEYKQLEGVPSDIGIGDAKFRDINGDGTISAYSDTPGEDGDLINVGTIMPRYSFATNLGAKFKNFDISFFFQGIIKRTLFRTDDYSIPWSDWWRQPPEFYYGKTWNEDRVNAEYPRLSHGNIRSWNYQPSTMQKINAAYVRLKNVQIGYTFSNRLIRRVAMSNARIYLSGQDIWELHGVKGGWDPESSSNGFNYPFQRMYSFGLDLTF